MTDKRPVIPLPGNAFSQQAYRDSLKATEEPGSPTGQDTSEKKPLPEAPQVHTVDRDSSGSSGSEKKPGDINLPKGMSEKVETHGKRAVIQPATPLTQGYVSKIKNVLGKTRAVTEPIARKPLNNSSSTPRNVSSDAGLTGGITGDVQVSQEDKSKAKGKNKGKAKAQDVPQQVTSEEQSAPETVVPHATNAEAEEPPVAPSSSTIASSQPESSSANHAASGSGSSSPSIFKGGEPALLQVASVHPRLSFFAPDDSEQEESESKKSSLTAEASTQQRHQPPEAIVLGDGRMSPTRSGTFARLGNVNIQSAPRVASISGQVETVIPVSLPEASPSIYSPVMPPQLNNPLPFNVPRHSGQPIARPDLDNATRGSHDTNAGFIPIGYRASEEASTPRLDHVPFNNFVPPPPGHEYRPPGWHEEIMYKVTDIPYHLMREMEALSREINTKHNTVMDYILRKNDATERRLTEMILQLAQKIVPLHDGPERLVNSILELGQKTTALEEAQARLAKSVLEVGQKTTALDESQERLAKSMIEAGQKITALNEGQEHLAKSILEVSQKITALVDEGQDRLAKSILELGQKTSALEESQERIAKSISGLSQKTATLEEGQERLTKPISGLAQKVTAIEEAQERLAKANDIRAQTSEITNVITNHRANASAKTDAVLSRLDALNSRFDSFDTRMNTVMRNQFSAQIPAEYYSADTGVAVPRGNAFAIAAATAAGHDPNLVSPEGRRVSGAGVVPVVTDATYAAGQQVQYPAFVPGMPVPYGPQTLPGFTQWYQHASVQPRNQQS